MLVQQKNGAYEMQLIQNTHIKNTNTQISQQTNKNHHTETVNAEKPWLQVQGKIRPTQC